MLFRKKMERSCNDCAYGTKMDEEHILCIKKGVVPATGKCRKFSYDPCKRVPVKPKTIDFSKYEEKDYSL